MCRSSKLAVYALACVLSGAAHCQALIPGTPGGTYGGDEIKGRDGTMCKQGTTMRPMLDVGVIGGNARSSDGSSVPYDNGTTITSRSTTAAGSQRTGSVYARVIIPLGAEPSRLDCSQLFNLEIERLKAELEKLKNSGSAALEVR